MTNYVRLADKRLGLYSLPNQRPSVLFSIRLANLAICLAQPTGLRPTMNASFVFTLLCGVQSGLFSVVVKCWSPRV